MKTKTILSANALYVLLLLNFFCLSLSAQVLPDFGVSLKKGELYYLDYEVSKAFSLRTPWNNTKPYEIDTHSIVKRTIRIEVIEALPDQKYLLSLTSERVASKLIYGKKISTLDDTYLESSLSRQPAQKTHHFSFGSLIAPPAHKNIGRIQSPQFTHLKVDGNLTVLKVYQNEEAARLDSGRAPSQPLHLWLDFDLIGIWLQPDQADLSPYLNAIWKKEVPAPGRATDHLQHFSAKYIDAMAVDTESGWLHFAQLTDEKEISPTLTVLKTIKGWKGEARKRTTVHGYFKNSKGIIRKENLTELVPYYFDTGRENLTIDPNGYFRWETYIDQPTYFSLRDLKGDELQKIYGYVQPGDELYVEADFKKLSTLSFKGKNEAANQFLNQNNGLPLPGLTEWLGQITIPVSKWAQDEVNELVITARQKGLERLQLQKSSLDPRFYQDEYWRLTYALARFIKPTADKEESLFSRDKFLPIANVQAEHLPAYWAYIEDFVKQQVQQHQFNSMQKSYLSFRERYNSTKLFLSGFPQHIVMYHALREALHHKKVAPGEVTYMKNEFLDLCRDKNLTDQVLLLSNRLEKTNPGHYFLNLQLVDTLGNKLEMKDFIGKKVVLEPIFHVSGGFNAKSYQAWQEKHPELHFIKLALLEKPTDFTAYKESEGINVPTQVTHYFLANKEEKEKAYHFLALDPLHRYSRYPHLFLLNEKGMITKQEFYSVDDNLAAFAQTPSVIIPFWKNPIWKVAIPLSIAIGLLTWLGLRIIGRIREKNLERQRHMVEMELNSIRSQLNPHFVYNTMSSIQNLILSDRSEQASQYLAELAGLMRAVLNQTKKGIISLEEELSTIRQYCKLEALRKSFAWNIQVDQSVDLHHTDIPALLLQPYVENAIIHGLRGNKEDGKIDLTITQNNGSLDIVIQDNGVGIADNQHRSLGGNHLGLHLNRKRLELLYGKLANVLIQDLKHLKTGKTGTQVAINIPI